MLVTSPACPRSVAVQFDVVGSQSLIVRSQLPEATALPFGATATEVTIRTWPERTPICSPSGRHSRTALSHPPVAIRSARGENAIDVTTPACPFNVTIDSPVGMRHSRAVLSHRVLPRTVRSGENATALITPPCPPRVARSAPLAASQSLTVRSQLAVAIVRPSGENSTAVTSPVWPRLGLSIGPDSELL